MKLLAQRALLIGDPAAVASILLWRPRFCFAWFESTEWRPPDL